MATATHFAGRFYTGAGDVEYLGLLDAASPDWAVHRQGDGRVEIHDWGMEFTAAGVLLQAELLPISRGPAANLLAPSYAGWRKPDGSFGQAYLAGLSITCIAALDRLEDGSFYAET